MEIVCMQLSYYCTLGLCLLVLDTLANLRPATGQIFVPSALDLSQSYSFVTFTANVVNIIFVVVAEAFIIEKANRCLDYTLTIFIVHLFCVIFYTGRFPWMLEWWAQHFAIIFVTVLLAEFVLMRIEQQEIKLSFDSKGISKIVDTGKQVIQEVTKKTAKGPKKQSKYAVMGSEIKDNKTK